jgi:hypothetical protein
MVKLMLASSVVLVLAVVFNFGADVQPADLPLQSKVQQHTEQVN